MKYSAIAIAALAQLASSSPLQKRQDIDFAAYEAQPTLADVAAPAGYPSVTPTASYNAAAVASTAAADVTTALTVSAAIAVSSGLEKRQQACSTNPSGAGPTASPDTPAGFQSNSIISADAAAATAPVGYVEVAQNALGAAQDATYLTYTLLNSYNATLCADFCQDTDGCNTFNLCMCLQVLIPILIFADKHSL